MAHTILNVDDYEPGRRATSRILKRAGFEVKEASTGNEALSLAHEMPDAIVLDVNLPDISGFEVCRRIRADPATARIPVLHLSAAYRDPNSKVHGLEGGAQAYLTQPIEPAVLIAYIDTLVRAREAEDALASEKRRLEVTLRSIGDGVITTDTQGRVIALNRKAEELTGQPEEEAIGRPVEEVFHIINEQTRDRCDNPVEKVLRTGSIVGPSNDTVLIAQDGTERILADNGAPVRDDAGNVLGVVLTFRDVTQERRWTHTLEENERRLSTLFANLPGIAYRCLNDSNWTMEFISEGCLELTGYSTADILDNRVVSYSDLIHPDDRHDIWSQVQRALAKDRPFQLEYRIRTRSGEERWVWEKGRRVIVHEGLVRLEGFISEVTDRKNAEKALVQAKVEWERTFDAVPDLMALIDREHCLIRVNKAMADRLGISPSEAIGLKCYEAVHGLASPPDFCPHVKAIRYGKEYSVEMDEPKLGGTFFLTSSPIFDEQGGFNHCVHVARDVTERKEAERALRRSEDRYQQLAEVAFEGIIFHDQGVLLEANDQFFEMTGYEPEELIGTMVTEKTVSPESLEVVNKHIASGSSKPYEAVGAKKDGTYFPMEIRVRLREIDGKGIRAVAIRDVSERKNMERQLVEAQKMEAVGTLAGGIAHDFNNLLQIIAGYSELLLMNVNKEAPVHNDLKAIHQAAVRGNELVKQILAFSRRLEPEFRTMCLNDEVLQVERFLYRTIPKMIEIELHLNGELWNIYADPGQMEQVLMNLAINAKDAMPNGGRLVFETDNIVLDREYAGTHLDVEPGKYVLLSVSDTGSGMDKTVGKRIFEPFFSTKGLGEGTGLGLAMVYGIVKSHRGQVQCYSEPNHGTTFKIYLPATEQKEPGDGEIAEEPSEGGTERILVVDDEPLISELAVKILTRVGYSVITAGSGKEALEVYEREHPNISLVILDLIMPEMGGKECLERLMKINPQVKVLIASGFTMNGQTRGLVRSGTKGHVDKPFNMVDLLRTIRKVLDTIG